MGSDGDGSSSGEDGDHQKWLKILHEQNLHTAVGELRKKRAQVEYAEADLEVKRANVVYFERMVELQKGGFIPPVGSLQVPLQPDVSVFPSSKRKGAQNPGGRKFQIFSQTTLKQTLGEPSVKSPKSSEESVAETEVPSKKPPKEKSREPNIPPDIGNEQSVQDPVTHDDSFVWPNQTCVYLAPPSQIKSTGGGLFWLGPLSNVNKHPEGSCSDFCGWVFGSNRE
ncbi:expressed unknown protein [Seminavis robusta]|uniref:Uncharacterized protein n=1 Tax=Seminavis robusta TaxID=568900 RepID=A0A9N8HWS8_9STRA|nr:expressed unknown protein [Seminavis robusta]|eukprot:Sro2776_g336850.1 n/a (225) ;mRNA; f:10982-11656